MMKLLWNRSNVWAGVLTMRVCETRWGSYFYLQSLDIQYSILKQKTR